MIQKCEKKASEKKKTVTNSVLFSAHLMMAEMTPIYAASSVSSPYREKIGRPANERMKTCFSWRKKAGSLLCCSANLLWRTRRRSNQMRRDAAAWVGWRGSDDDDEQRDKEVNERY
jgi:hypothetical protein